MTSFLKAASLGAFVAVAVFFFPLVFPLLMTLLLIGLLRRAFFVRRLGHWGDGMNRWNAHAHWGLQAGQPVPIDGRHWHRLVPSGGSSHDVNVR